MEEQEYKHKCDECGMKFKVKRKLESHCLSHCEGSYKCTVCGKGYRIFSYFCAHVMQHAEVETHFCPYCRTNFQNASDLNQHKSMHMQINNHYLCDICLKSFTTKDKMTDHKKEHLRNNYFPCIYCTSVFSSQCLLAFHKMTSHKRRLPLDFNYPETTLTSGNQSAGHIVDKMPDKYFTSVSVTDNFSLVSIPKQPEQSHSQPKHKPRILQRRSNKNAPRTLQKKMDNWSTNADVHGASSLLLSLAVASRQQSHDKHQTEILQDTPLPEKSINSELNDSTAKNKSLIRSKLKAMTQRSVSSCGGHGEIVPRDGSAAGDISVTDNMKNTPMEYRPDWEHMEDSVKMASQALSISKETSNTLKVIAQIHSLMKHPHLLSMKKSELQDSTEHVISQTLHSLERSERDIQTDHMDHMHSKLKWSAEGSKVNFGEPQQKSVKKTSVLQKCSPGYGSANISLQLQRKSLEEGCKTASKAVQDSVTLCDISEDDGQIPYPCSLCKETFLLKELRFHIGLHTGEFRPQDCPEHKVSQTKHNDIIDKRMHSKLKQTCEGFETNLEEPQQKSARRTSVLQMPFPEYCSSNSSYLQLEEDKEKSSGPGAGCETSSKVVKNKITLCDISKDGDQISHFCSLCGQKFFLTELRLHLGLHTGEFIQCKKCQVFVFFHSSERYEGHSCLRGLPNGKNLFELLKPTEESQTSVVHFNTVDK